MNVKRIVAKTSRLLTSNKDTLNRNYSDMACNLDSAPERLLKVIDVVLKGEYFMELAVSQKVVQRIAGVKADHRSMTDAGYETPTPREQEILAPLAEGQALKSISERLFISPKTVENHRPRIMHKLGVHSTMEMIRYATKLGIIDLDLWKDYPTSISQYPLCPPRQPGKSPE